MIQHRRALKYLVLGLLFLFSCSTHHSVVRPARHPVVPLGATVQIDPGIVFGVLDNGFQYILMENDMPEGRVNLHLDVFAGSMHETDEQSGVAHYLEHLLFNGSEHFKPGELIKYFQSIGMDFGADANAHTSFFNTVYDLTLPKGDQAYLEDAFVILQDYAKGALLLETEIDRERGIILAEKRERDSVSYRTFKKTLEFELPESLFYQRFPIGMDPVLKTADRTLLKGFYDQWYRPDNMALIIVGDFDSSTVLPLITKRFSKLTSRATVHETQSPTRWKAHQGEKVFYHYEPEAGSTEVSIETISWKPFEPETPDTVKKRALSRMADALLQNRLSRMVSRQTAEFSEAAVFSGSFMHHIQLSSIQATCEPGKWQQGLEQIEKTLRQGILFGFTQKELGRVKAEFISSLEQQVSQAGSRKSRNLARQILSTVNRKGLLLSPVQKKDLLEPYIRSVSLKDVQTALTASWAEDHRLILVTGTADIQTEAPETTILDAYRQSLTQTVVPYENFESKPFPYLKVPVQKDTVKIRQDNVKNLGITTIDFQNGVRLNVKKTDYKKNEISFKVSFGQGKKSEPLSMPGLSLLSEQVIEAGGLGRLDIDQLEEALAGRKVSIRFEVDEAYFSLSGAGDPGEAELIFQLIYHYLNDPGYRVEALNLAKTKYKQQYDNLLRTPKGIMQIKGDGFLAKNDPRFGLTHPDMMNGYALNDIKNWLSGYFKDAPVEVSIVGDVDVDKVITLASTYMGALNKRKLFTREQGPKDDIGFPEGERLDLKVDTKIDTGTVHIAFLTDDFWDITQTRKLSLLSRVFSERLRVVIREELGEAYSPYVYNDPSLGFDGYGVLHVVVNVKPDNHEFVYHKVKEIVASLAGGGISEEETQLVLKPVLNHLDVIRNTNRYWLNSVMTDASRHPEKFDWAKTMIRDYESITHTDLNRLAGHYLDIKKSALIVITRENHK